MLNPTRQKCWTPSRGFGVAALAAAALTLGPSDAWSQIREAAPPPLDLSTLTATPLSDEVVLYRDVTYAVIPGFRPLKLDLYAAGPTAAPRPAVLWIHGGGWSTGDPRASNAIFPDWPAVLGQLAARGYVVLGVSYRLSGEARFPAALQDVKAAIRWARLNARALGIDPERIAAWGGSAGGQLAALAGTSCGVADLEGSVNAPGQVSSCVQAVIDWYGPTDMARMDEQAEAIAGSRRHGGPGAESSYLGCLLAQCDRQVVQAANPLAYVSPKTPPFLVIHGTADRAVPPGQSEILVNGLRAVGVSARLIRVSGADHLFAGVSSDQAAAILASSFDFLDAALAPTRAATAKCADPSRSTC